MAAKKKGKRVAAGSGSGSGHFKAYNDQRAEAKWYAQHGPKASSSAPIFITDDDLPF